MPHRGQEQFDPVSANTLFHFTSSIDHILSILTHEFQPHYCLEDFRIFQPVAQESLEMAIPMVCFCDLPLFSVKKHLSFYGSYGIGMSKSWARHQTISPVLYLTANSPLSRSLGGLLLAADREETLRTSPRDPWRRSDLLSSYIKPYEGSMLRNGRRIQRVRFYDEREWRFVPDSSLNGFLPALSKRHVQDKTLRQRENARVAQFRLHFTPDDIKYLIVKGEEEILPLIRSIERIKGRFEPDTIKLLTTRIITLDQIREDF